jgi:two-component system cell cycle response regulator
MLIYEQIQLLQMFLFFLLFSMTTLLFRKWNHRIFLFLATASLLASLQFFIPKIFKSYELINAFSDLIFIILNASVYYLFKPKQIQKLLIYAGFSIAVIIIPIALISLSNLPMMIVSTILLGSFIVYVYMYSYPYLGKKKTYLFSIIFYTIASSVQKSEIVHSMHLEVLSTSFQLFSYYLLFLTVFDRVIEMIQYFSQTTYTDALTGLYNRRYFNKQTINYLEEGLTISVLFCDIDNFKKLNDTKGHQRGDEVLKDVAKILIEEASSHAKAGRYGGEEMVVLLHDSSIEPAELAERLRSRIEAETEVTISLGYSTSTTGIDAETLIKKADLAMYKAKTSGKNRIVEFVENEQMIATTTMTKTDEN